LNAFVEWGERCVHYFNGMWAFAIWDSERKELFLSRDRFGKKPLFYAFVSGKFIFASEMKAIFPFLHEVRPSKHFDYMRRNVFSYEATDMCLVEGVSRFPAGSNGYYRNGHLEIVKYWSTLDNLTEVPTSYGQQVEEFRELFMDACRIRMRSDVSLGTALSGGLDSSATMCAMAHLACSSGDEKTRDWQHAFVASFPDTPLDETRYAGLVVDKLNIDATYIDIDPVDEWGKIEDYFYKFEEIYLTTPLPMIMTYAAVKKSGVSVTLDGHGADELFCGYGHVLEALWDCKFSISETKDILDTYVDTLIRDQQFNQINKVGVYSRYMIKKLAKIVLGKEINNRELNFSQLDNLTKQLYIIFHDTILPTLLRNYDRYSMINSVESRMPFMDHRLVCYVNSLPYSSKVGGGYTKKLVRDAMAPYMPPEITWRKSKIGFNTPIVDWMQNSLSEWFSDTVHEKKFIESELIDDPLALQKKVMSIVNKKNSNFSDAEKIWTMLSSYIWGKAILDRKYS
jgi:asparagine synthase (glutamine-hydrolysing)